MPRDTSVTICAFRRPVSRPPVPAQPWREPAFQRLMEPVLDGSAAAALRRSPPGLWRHRRWRAQAVGSAGAKRPKLPSALRAARISAAISGALSSAPSGACASGDRRPFMPRAGARSGTASPQQARRPPCG
jgi:hypothetical protein